MNKYPGPVEKSAVTTALDKVLQVRKARKAADAVGACGPSGPSIPTHTPGEPPLNKMGVTGFNGAPIWQPRFDFVQLVMSTTGEVKQIPVRARASGQCAVIDWVNFTVSADTWLTTAKRVLITDDEHVCEASRVLADIFGFGVTRHYGKRLNFYQDSWVLGEDAGFVCFGGQNNSMLIMLNGLGCRIAANGWERRLHAFMTGTALLPKLTRVDLAHDCFDGSYLTVDWADAQWELGGYTSATGGRAPNIEHKGNWRKPTGAGRTLNIGRRESGKYLRVYEKGKAEGDESSAWTRAEVEFKSADRILPFDMLTEPGMYFVGAYQCFQIFENHKAPESVEIRKNEGKLTFEDSLNVTSSQFGKHISVQRQLYHELGLSDSDLLDRLQHSDPNCWPKRLLQVSKTLESCPESFHQRKQALLDLEALVFPPAKPVLEDQ